MSENPYNPHHPDQLHLWGAWNERHMSDGETHGERIERKKLNRQVGKDGNMTKKNRLTICLDFDGVVHHYRNGWPGDPRVIDDEPTPGVVEAVDAMLGMGYEVKVHSARCHDSNAVAAIGSYLRKHDIRAEVVKTKPPSALYVDDRGFRFRGDWAPLLRFVRDPENLTPWNKRANTDTLSTAAKLVHCIQARLKCVAEGKQGVATLGPALGWLDELGYYVTGERQDDTPALLMDGLLEVFGHHGLTVPADMQAELRNVVNEVEAAN